MIETDVFISSLAAAVKLTEAPSGPKVLSGTLPALVLATSRCEEERADQQISSNLTGFAEAAAVGGASHISGGAACCGAASPWADRCDTLRMIKSGLLFELVLR